MRSACKADNLTAICERIVWKIWELRSLKLMTLHGLYRDSFTFLPLYFFRRETPQLQPMSSISPSGVNENI
jgi:hypothetical protein